MNYLDLLVLALGSVLTLLVFVQKANIDQSKVRVKVKAKIKK